MDHQGLPRVIEQIFSFLGLQFLEPPLYLLPARYLLRPIRATDTVFKLYIVCSKGIDAGLWDFIF
jgi:hypothetical protein